MRVTARTGEQLLRIAAEIQLIGKRLASAGLHDEAQACALYGLIWKKSATG